MKRLDDETLAPFLAEDGLAMVLFGATSGGPTAMQADEFAMLWAEGGVEARFGYVDALWHDEARRQCGVRVLPTTLLIEHGAILRRFEGFHPRHRLEAACKRLKGRPVCASTRAALGEWRENAPARKQG